MRMTNSIQIEDHPTAERVRTYHVRELLTDQTIAVEKGLCRVVPGIAGMLFDLPGVDCVVVKPYLAQISIARSYTWPEVEPKLLEMLAPFAGEPRPIEERERRGYGPLDLAIRGAIFLQAAFRCLRETIAAGLERFRLRFPEHLDRCRRAAAE